MIATPIAIAITTCLGLCVASWSHSEVKVSEVRVRVKSESESEVVFLPRLDLSLALVNARGVQ